MKRFLLLLPVLLMLIFVGCDSDSGSDPDLHPLVGSWTLSEYVYDLNGEITRVPVDLSVGTQEFVFQSNGSVIYEISGTGTRRLIGTWSAEGSTLTLLLAGDTIVYEYSVVGNVFSIEVPEDNVTLVFNRS